MVIFQVPKTETRQKSSSESLNLGQKSILTAAFCQKEKKKSVPQASKIGADPFYNPYQPKPKLSAPPWIFTPIYYLTLLTTNLGQILNPVVSCS